MTKVLYPNATIGIIGAGQLGKMLAQSAQKMGYNVAFLDPNPTSCGFNVANWHVVAPFDDRKALLDFAEKVDVLTYEFENIHAELLGELSQKAHLPQGIDLLLTSQHRLKEKQWLKEIGVSVVDHVPVQSMSELKAGLAQLGYPAILKTTRFGYDGKGQFKLTRASDLAQYEADLTDLVTQPCILEAFCPFEYEVSVMVSRDMYGTIELFPISRNVHRQGILFTSLAPSVVEEHVAQQVQAMAQTIATAAQLIGVCGIEFFVQKNGKVVVNELAPRPHNTGHYTMESCNVSQYDQHILAITGRPIVPVEVLSPALMVNILGQHIPLLPEAMAQYPTAMYHLYNKGEAKSQRKMGHFTFVAPHEALEHILSSPLVQQWGDLFEQ